ncbi:MAG: hypothetical protein QW400_04115 [Candidatus Diapherotrites archaeon]
MFSLLTTQTTKKASKDQKQHYIIEQCAVNGEYDFSSSAWEFLIKPGEIVSAIGFYKPPKELGKKPIYMKALTNGALVSTPNSNECMLFCKSCNYDYRSVKITLES